MQYVISRVQYLKCINTLARWLTLLQCRAVIYCIQSSIKWTHLAWSSALLINLLWFNKVSLNWFYNYCSANLLNFITNDYTKLWYAARANMCLWRYPWPMGCNDYLTEFDYTTSRLYSVLRGVYFKICHK